ncbi:MAG: UbiX family flavin prenyltransferase [Pseudomonadales bacterium]|nr:UbiX family flavin prenyltransferase [Pseudomonadales bacterium]
MPHGLSVTDKTPNTVTLAITGASGVQYAVRLLEQLLLAGVRVNMLISKAAHLVIATETDLNMPAKAPAVQRFFLQRFATAEQPIAEDLLHVYETNTWMAPIASGSGRSSAMVVCPCTTGTLSSIATGACENLIDRAADVTLKEQRKLILMVRETPFSVIQLENMLKLANMGVVVMPANPGFYFNPTTVEEIVDFMVARVLDHLDIEHSLMPKWGD